MVSGASPEYQQSQTLPGHVAVTTHGNRSRGSDEVNIRPGGSVQALDGEY